MQDPQTLFPDDPVAREHLAHLQSVHPGKHALRPSEAGPSIGRSPKTLERDRALGRGPEYVKEARGVAYPLPALAKYLAARRVTTQETPDAA